MFYGDVTRPEVLNAFNVGKAKAVICTLAEVKGTNTAVVNLRREFPDLPVRTETRQEMKKRERCVCVLCVWVCGYMGGFVRVDLSTVLLLCTQRCSFEQAINSSTHTLCRQQDANIGAMNGTLPSVYCCTVSAT